MLNKSHPHRIFFYLSAGKKKSLGAFCSIPENRITFSLRELYSGCNK